jgi:hypothetical protein
MVDQPPLSWVHYLPLGTTLLSAWFATVLFHRYVQRRSGPHLLWWGCGIVFYGLGTLLESLITLLGNTVFLNKSWYIAGALLGGYPLAQGTVYLLFSRRFAHTMSACTLPVIVGLSLLVILSPVRLELIEAHRPSGAVLAWSWIRWLTPFINLYAASFLIGGAAVSAWRYLRSRGLAHRALGNASIAVGALLPGIGGAMAKGGLVEALYVGEFLGILLIWAGYALCVKVLPMTLTGQESRIGY